MRMVRTSGQAGARMCSGCKRVNGAGAGEPGLGVQGCPVPRARPQALGGGKSAAAAGREACECSVCGEKRSVREVVACSKRQHRVCGACLGPRALVLAARKAAFTEAGHLRCRECTGRACEGVLAYVEVAARLVEDGRSAEADRFINAAEERLAAEEKRAAEEWRAAEERNAAFLKRKNEELESLIHSHFFPGN